MSVAEQISRIQQDRNTIRNKLVALGLATGTDNLDVLAEAIDDIKDNGSITAEVKEGETYTIPAGFHSGTGTVSGVAGGGNYKLQSKIVTPTKKTQVITPDEGNYGLSDVNVNPIPDAYQDVTAVTAAAGDVLQGKIIVTKDGTVTAGAMPNNGDVNVTLNQTHREYTIPAGFHTGAGKVIINVAEDAVVTPTKAQQEVVATDGLYSKVTINAIPDAYQDVTSVDATAADIISGKKIVDATGAVVIGTMANNGDVTATIDGITSTSVEIPAGYTSGGTISLTGDIEAQLAAI